MKFKKLNRLSAVALSIVLLSSANAAYASNLITADGKTTKIESPKAETTVEKPKAEEKTGLETNNKDISKLVETLNKETKNVETPKKEEPKTVEDSKVKSEPKPVEKTVEKTPDKNLISTESTKPQMAGNCKITPKKEQDKSQKEYKVTINFVDYETMKTVKSQDFITKKKELPQNTHFELPQGYVIDYMTKYKAIEVDKNVDVEVLVRKNRFVRCFDKDSNLIASFEINRFTDYYEDVIPAGFKQPKFAYNGFRLDGNYFVKDFVLNEWTKDDIDYTKGDEHVNKILDNIKNLQKVKQDLKEQNAKYEIAKLDAQKAKIIESTKKEEVDYDKQETVKTAPKVNPNIKVYVKFVYTDDITGKRVGESIHRFNKNEKLTLKDVPQGYENVDFVEKDYYVQNPIEQHIKVRRTMSVDNLIKLNNEKSTKDQSKDQFKAIASYDKNTGRNTKEEIMNQHFPIDAYKEPIGENRQFKDLTEKEQEIKITVRIENDNKTKTVDPNLKETKPSVEAAKKVDDNKKLTEPEMKNVETLGGNIQTSSGESLITAPVIPENKELIENELTDEQVTEITKNVQEKRSIKDLLILLTNLIRL